MAIPIATLLKTITKFTGRQILRRTGVFGTYGTLKKFMGQDLTKLDFLKKVTTSIIKKNLLKQLGPMNYFNDIFKKGGGVKYAMKQFGYQRLTPMAIKKVWYLYQNYERTFGKKNPIIQQSKAEIWKQIGRNGKHSYLWKLERIEETMKSEGVPKKFKKELLNNWFYFRVKSAQTHNFSQRVYKWNPATGELVAYVRSANKNIYGPYFAYNVPVEIIKKSIKTTSYGKMVYWPYYKK